jgi:hypothetical protein
MPGRPFSLGDGVIKSVQRFQDASEIRRIREGLLDRVNGLLHAEEGSRGWPMRFFTPERLFSVGARSGWIEPDREYLPCSEH